MGGGRMPLTSGITSVMIDRAFFVLSAAVVSTVGLLAVLIVLPLPHSLALYAGLFAFTLLGFVMLTAVAVRSRWPVLSGAAQIVGRIRYFKDWVEGKRSVILSIENSLLDFYHRTPGSFWASFALNLACHAAAICEVYLVLWLLGAKISFVGALAIEALTKLVNIAGTFNPGNIGTYEGGNMLIVKMFGLTGATGLTLAFMRRLRAIFWAAIGGLCLVMLTKTQGQKNLVGTREGVMPIELEGLFPNYSHIARLLTHNLGAPA